MPLNIVKIERDDTFKIHRDKMNSFIDKMNYNVLEFDKNLDDVKDKQTVRDNLNLYRRDQVWNKGEADNRFYEESKLFGEHADSPQLRGGSDSKATIRRKQANNLDMYIKGDLYTRTESDARYLNESSNLADLPDKQAARNVLSLYTRQETREGSLWNYGTSSHNLDTIIKDPKQQGLYQRNNNGPTGYAYGGVTSLSTGNARSQIYSPHYHNIKDDLTDVVTKRSALHVRTGWGNDLKAWEHILTENSGNAYYFRKNNLFSELTGSTRATDRRTATNNLDVYQKADVWNKGEADARFLNESSNLADLPNKQTARNVLSLYTKQETHDGSLWGYGVTSDSANAIMDDNKKQGYHDIDNKLIVPNFTGYGQYGSLLSFNGGLNKAQIYVPQYYSSNDDLNGSTKNTSAIFVRSGRSTTKRTWDRVITEVTGDQIYFRKNKLFSELTGSARATDRRTATNNLDVYQKADVWNKGEADARFLNESSNLSDLTNKQAARDVLSLYTRQETREGALWGYGSSSNTPDHIFATNNIQGHHDIENKLVVPNFTGYGQYGTLLSFNGGVNKAQVYVPQYYTSTDDLDGSSKTTSTMFVRSGRGTTKRTWDFALNETVADQKYFRKNKLFSELSGSARATNRRTATNNLDVYQKADVYNKGQADSRFFNVTGDTVNGNIQLNGHLYVNGSTGLHIFESSMVSYIRNRRSGATTQLQSRNNGGSYVNSISLIGGANPHVALQYGNSNKLSTTSSGITVQGQTYSTSKVRSPEFTDNANFTLKAANYIAGASDVGLSTIQGTNRQRFVMADSQNTFYLDTSSDSGSNWTNLFKVSSSQLLYKSKRVYHEGDKPNRADVGLSKVDNYSRAEYDGRYALKVGTGTNSYSTTNRFHGKTEFDTSKGFRLKRTNVANTGDDVVDLVVDDSGLNFHIDNDNDADSSWFNVTRKVAGNRQNIFTVNHASIKHLTHNVFHEGNLNILTPSRLGGGGDSGAYTKAETRALFADVSENLADVNAGAARTNLGVYSKSEVDTKHNDTFKISKRFSEVRTMTDTQRTEVWNNLDVYSRSQIDANFQSGATTYLAKGSNLSDLTDKVRARTNLGLGNAATRNFAGNDGGIGYSSGDDNDIARGDHTHFKLFNIDTRSDNLMPNTYRGRTITNEFKYSNKIGAGTTATYSNVLTFRPWSSDAISHRATQLAMVSQDQRAKVRFSNGSNGWNGWKTLAYTTDKAPNSTLLDGKSLAHVLDWNNTTNKPSIAPANHNHDTVYLKLNAKAVDSDKLDGINSTQFLRKDQDNVMSNDRKIHFASSTEGATLFRGQVDETYGAAGTGNDWFHVRKTDANGSTPDSGVVFDWTATSGGNNYSGWSLALKANNAYVNGALYVNGQRALTTSYGTAVNANKLDNLDSSQFVRKDIDQTITAAKHVYTGDVQFTGNRKGVQWYRNSDLGFIIFKNDGDGDTDSYMQYGVGDNNNEYHKWTYGNKLGDVGSTGMELKQNNLDVYGHLKVRKNLNVTGGDHVFNSGGVDNTIKLFTASNKNSTIFLAEESGRYGGKLVYTGASSNVIALIGRENNVDKTIFTAHRGGSSFDFKVLPTVNGTTLLTSTATAANSNKLGNVAASAYIRRDVSSSLNSGVTLRLGSQGALRGSKNNKHILHDHNNGQITLAADGGILHLGYNSGTTHVTTGLRLATDLSNVNGSIKVVDHNTGELSDKGTTLETKYARRNGESNQDFKVKKLVIEDTVEIRKNTDGSIGFYL